jgi:hypothetical protein
MDGYSKTVPAKTIQWDEGDKNSARFKKVEQGHPKTLIIFNSCDTLRLVESLLWLTIIRHCGVSQQ